MPVTTTGSATLAEGSSTSNPKLRASTKKGTSKHKSKAQVAKDAAEEMEKSALAAASKQAEDHETTMRNLELKPVFKTKIMGDIFGVNESMAKDSLLGMMYRSRVQEDEMHALAAFGKGEHTADLNNESKKAKEQVDDISVFEDNSDDEPESFEGLNSRQQLALTIRNWSSMEENDQYIIEEGAVHAVIGLASMDDSFIKKCCAKALDNLSSREQNREQLLSLGAATGVIQIAMAVRDYKIAKLCARTLCSLSMFPNGEAVMARDGAILALVILLGLKGSRLLPIAAQSLYNLTCVKDHFKGMERTVKAFLALPVSTHDTSTWFLKSLVNCCRYSWIRMRIIEDGAIAGIAAVVPNLGQKENPHELVELIAVGLRLLSESIGCRIELLAKGALNILQGIIPYGNDTSRIVMAKALHNITQHALNNNQFSLSVQIACDLALTSEDPAVMEYISACFQQFASEGLLGDSSLANSIMDALPQCLSQSSRPLTQFYSVTTAGNLFFMKNTDSHKLETLIERVISLGDTITDPEAMEALAVALAKLTQDEFSMAILEKKQLFDGMLKLVLELLNVCGDHLVMAKEACPIAICRVAIKLGAANLKDERKPGIAKGLLQLLQSDQLSVLGNAICAIRALYDHDICKPEFLVYADTLFTQLATIVKQYGDGNKALCRNCCALIAGLSYKVEAHEGLAKQNVMDVLFLTTRSDDTITRELVAITICNMTVSTNACIKLIESGVCEIIATLSGATSEDIQNLCAKCICNITCATEQHTEIISHGVLQTILLIALVRTVEDKTKLLCARAVMNLLSDANIDSLKEAGVIRVFASIAAVLNINTQIQCAQGFLIFSITEARRDDVCSRRPVLQALFLMIKSANPQCRILVGMTVCNLLSCPKSQKLAVAAGALQVLKIISTMEYPILREATVRVIMNLMQVKALYPVLLRSAPIVPMINYILHKSGGADVPPATIVEGEEVISSARIFDCAVHAMSCVAQQEAFREHMYEKDGIPALVTSVLAGKVRTAETATEVVRTLCLLSYQFDRTMALLDSQVVLALLVLYRNGHITPVSAEMMCILIRNCSTREECREPLIKQGAILLMRGLQRPLVDCSIAVARSIIIAADMFARDEGNHDAMVEHGIVHMMYDIVHPKFRNRIISDKKFPIRADQSYSKFQHDDAYEKLCMKHPKLSFSLSSLDLERLSKTCFNLSRSPSVHMSLVQGSITTWVKVFLSGPIEDNARGNIASAMCNISATRSARQPLVDMGSNELLLDLCKDTELMSTKSQCQIALGNLSDITHLGAGAVSSLLELTVVKEDENQTVNADGGTPAETAENATAEDGTTMTDTGTGTLTGGGEVAKKSTKSLRQLIRDGLLNSKNKAALKRGGTLTGGVVNNFTDSYEGQSEVSPAKTAKKARSMLVGRLRNLTAHDMETVDAINREREGLMQDYSKIDYKIYSNFPGDFGVEQGGIASKHSAALGLPSISQASKKTASGNRSADIAKLEINKDSLAKDIRVMDIDAMAEAVNQAEREAEEKEAAEKAAATAAAEAAEAATMAARNASSPTPGGDGGDGLYTTGSGKKRSMLKKQTSRGSRGSISSGRPSVQTVKGAGTAWGEQGDGGATLAPGGTGPGSSSPSRNSRR